MASDSSKVSTTKRYDDKLLQAIGFCKQKKHGEYELDYSKEYHTKGGSMSSDLAQCLLPDETFFRVMRKPKRGDWLAEHKESGQTFQKYLQGSVTRPTQRRNIIYLLPLVFNEDPVPREILAPLQQYASLYFGMPVKLLEAQNLKDKVSHRLNDSVYQVKASDVLKIMRDEKMRPKDGFCVAAITMCDLYPRDAWNFVFGLASRGTHCGVYSLARYLSNFGETETTEYKPESEEGGVTTVLKRACKTMCHEIGHMFGLAHCTHFDCNMNGSNSMEESDRRTIFLCPVCLRKIQFATRMDIITRYRKLKDFWENYDQKTEVDWLRRRIDSLTRRS